MPQQPSKLLPAVYGGLIIGVVSGIPFLSWINCACCAGVMAGGFLAVYLFRRNLDSRYHMDMSDGAQLGLLAGVFGAMISTALSQLFMTVSLEMVQKFMALYIKDPDLDALFDQFSPEKFAHGWMLFSFVLSLVIYSIFGLIGGLIGVSMVGKSRQPYYQQTQPPMPPSASSENAPQQDLPDGPV